MAKKSNFLALRGFHFFNEKNQKKWCEAGHDAEAAGVPKERMKMFIADGSVEEVTVEEATDTKKTVGG